MTKKRTSGTTAAIAKDPGPFVIRVAKGFRANQGFLLAGAVAYHTLLSLVPLTILVLIGLSHFVEEAELLRTMDRYLELVVPGQSDAIMAELTTFLNHRDVIGWVLIVTILFFSSLAFTVLENAMSVIFHHRAAIERRHFLISALIPYCFILSLGIGLLVMTVVSGFLQTMGAEDIDLFGKTFSLGGLSGFLFYAIGVIGEVLVLSAIYLVMPVGSLVMASRIDRRRHSGGIVGNHPPHARRLLLDIVTSQRRVRFTDDFYRRAAEPGNRGDGSIDRRTGHRGIRALP